ncbi:MAG TPA: NAD+ synthase [Firmicutes bacterium]|nr:NAD+ synthase [Bacillota bacterium]
MKVALAQFNPTAGSLNKNRQKIEQFYRSACAAGAWLVLFPELALTGYPPGDLLLYKGFIEEVAEVINTGLAPLTKPGYPSMLIGAPYRSGGHLYNAALLLKAEEVRPVQFKGILTGHRYFYENHYFTPGSELKTIDLYNQSAGIIIGEGAAESTGSRPLNPGLVKQLVSKGAGTIINLTASRYYYGYQAARERELAALAEHHRTGVIVVNQVGSQDGLIFGGASLIFNRAGELIYRGAPFAEELFCFDLPVLYRPAGKALPPLQEDIGWICKGLQLGIKDYLSKNGFTRAAVGLSGGIDSAVVATLAVKALGAENVLGVLMPSPYSSSHSVEDTLALVANLGIEHRLIPINSPFQSFSDLLNPAGKLQQDLAEENLQARIRGDILMFISNRERYLVLTTGNRSELAVGYCTLYGDMAGGLAVLGDLPKLMVYELARHLNRHREIIPRHTIRKPPSAELRPDQRDDQSLPPYPLLDPVLHLYLEENLSAGEIAARGYPEGTVRRIIQLVDKAGYKQRQMPPRLWITSSRIERRTPGFR